MSSLSSLLKDTKFIAEVKICVHNHRDMWGRLASTGGYKREVLSEAEYVLLENSCDCYACEFTDRFKLSCEDCPFEWGGGANCTDESESVYSNWGSVGCEDREERKYWAGVIRDIPLKDIYKDSLDAVKGVACE